MLLLILLCISLLGIFPGMNFISRVVMEGFFRDVEVVAEGDVPEGPLIIYANHNNQFVDALVIFAYR